MVTQSGELTADEKRELAESLAHWDAMNKAENDSNFRGLAWALGATQPAEGTRSPTPRL